MRLHPWLGPCLLCCQLGLSFGCQSQVDSNPVLSERVSTRALLDQVEPGSGSFADGDCYPCAERICAGPDAACRADPGCAVYRDCLLACPQLDDGSLDPSCADECEVVNNSTSERSSQALRRCLVGVDCQECLGDGGTAAPAPGDTRPECAPSDDNATECSTCLWAQCCDYEIACHATDQCFPFRDCVVDCGGVNAACIDQCGQEYPEGQRPLLQMIECAQEVCLSECADATNACSVCAARECGSIALACIADAECWAMMSCFQYDCVDSADPAKCQDDCARQTTPAGVDGFFQWLDCIQGRCLEECSG
jgi:hypothetical protein